MALSDTEVQTIVSVYTRARIVEEVIKDLDLGDDVEVDTDTVVEAFKDGWLDSGNLENFIVTAYALGKAEAQS